MRFRDRFARFMYGRYGSDQLSRCMLIIALILVLLSNFIRTPVRSVLYFMGILVLVLVYYRMFSKNISKRYEENQIFLARTAGIRARFAGMKNRTADRSHRIFKCPTCSQKIRVPKGKGKIEITCPKCKTKFIKVS